MKKHTQDLYLSLWKRRGFLSEAKSPGEWTYSYGPLGAELKRNLINDWWNAVVTTSGNIQGLDNSIVAPSLAHKTEGTFNHSDPKVGARELQASFEDHATALTSPAPSSSRASDQGNIFRHSILQGLLHQRAGLANNLGLKAPFGMAEVGRIFKRTYPLGAGINVMEPHLLRAEQDQAGMIFVCPSKTGREWYAHWQKSRLRWWKKLSHNPGAFVLKETSKQDVPQSTLQYSTIQYLSPWGSLLLEAIIHHGECGIDTVPVGSDKQQEGEGVEPNVQLLSCVAEIDRGTLALLCDSYTEAKRPHGPGADLVDSMITRLHRRLAPYKVAVLPAKESHKQLHLYCQMLAAELRQSGISTVYNSSDTLENRLVIQDEIGTPYRVIADEGSLETGIVSLQDRDTTASEDMNGQDLLQTLQRMMFGFHMT